MGGIIVDPDGKPVAGVQVSPSIEFKKRPGDVRQFGSGARVTTDAAGKWRFDSVPVSMAEVHVEIDHPSFMPIRRLLERREFGIEPGREPASKIVLDRGLTVTGKVTDEAGKADRRGPGAHQVLERRPRGHDGAGRRLHAGRLRAEARPSRGVRQGPGDGHEGAQHRAGDGTGRLPDEARRHRAHPRAR